MSRVLPTAVAALALAGAATLAAAPAEAAVPHFRNCAALNARFPHGVGRPGAVDHTSGTPVTSFVRNRAIYRTNTARDGDKDGIACEKA